MRKLLLNAIVATCCLPACSVDQTPGKVVERDAQSPSANAGASGAGAKPGTNVGSFGGSPNGASTGGDDSSSDADVAVDAGMDEPPPVACPTGMDGSGRGLRGEYFDQQNLTDLTIVRVDRAIDFDWGFKSPERTLPADHFSTRWTGQVQPRFSGAYTFYTNTDDGSRLSVDGMVIMEHFVDHMPVEDSGTITLEAGRKYDIRMEYYENQLGAQARLGWSSDCQPRETIPTTQLYLPASVCAASVAGAGTGLKGEYFDNDDLTGLPAITRTDPTVSFDWPAGASPGPAVAPTSYSVRWSGQVQPKFDGFQTFYTTSDDGVRLFVDDILIIDNWTDHPPTEDSGTIKLNGGQKYNVRLEYHQSDNGGQVKLSWESECQTKEVVPVTQLFPTFAGMTCPAPSAAGTGTGLKGEYYDNQDLTDLKLTRTDPTVSFEWVQGSPDATIGVDTFAARWTGQIEARYTKTTTFYTVSDDGVRLWVGGQLVIDNWTNHQLSEDMGTIVLVAGQKYDVKMEFFENDGEATAKLSWASYCQTRQPIPTTQLYPTGYTGADVDAGQ